MSVRSSFLAVVGTVFDVGCAQTPSPTNPSPTFSGASAAVPASSLAVPGSATGTLTPTAVIGRPEYELNRPRAVSSP
jgi:hypothetical protein